jgi:hypothetical protein
MLLKLVTLMMFPPTVLIGWRLLQFGLFALITLSDAVWHWAGTHFLVAPFVAYIAAAAIVFYLRRLRTIRRSEFE